jgi:hypothetical protein
MAALNPTELALAGAARQAELIRAREVYPYAVPWKYTGQPTA